MRPAAGSVVTSSVGPGRVRGPRPAALVVGVVDPGERAVRAGERVDRAQLPVRVVLGAVAERRGAASRPAGRAGAAGGSSARSSQPVHQTHSKRGGDACQRAPPAGGRGSAGCPSTSAGTQPARSTPAPNSDSTPSTSTSSSGRAQPPALASSSTRATCSGSSHIGTCPQPREADVAGGREPAGAARGAWREVISSRSRSRPRDRRRGRPASPASQVADLGERRGEARARWPWRGSCARRPPPGRATAGRRSGSSPASGGPGRRRRPPRAGRTPPRAAGS